jgi:hypothetical protein
VLVSRVLGLRNIADMQPDTDTGSVDPVGSYIDRDRDDWQVLDLAAVTRDPRFLHVGA